MRRSPAAESLEIPGPEQVEAEVDVLRRLAEWNRLDVLVYGRLPLIAREEGEPVPEQRFFDGQAPADAVGVDLREPGNDFAVDRDRVRDRDRGGDRHVPDVLVQARAVVG